jgi:hypothetical protein
MQKVDLAIVIVSHDDERWLPSCLGSIYGHRGSASLDVVVVDNGRGGGAETLVRDDYPETRTIRCANRGFGHANNRGASTCDARYILFLNPDTEIREGDFGELVALLDERPLVGLAGVRQVRPDATLYPTIRRFPNALRALAEALALERLGRWTCWAGERELNPAVYERETPCNWTSGSFVVARREALLAAGLFDERFFLYAEEVDLARRVTSSGWEVRHLPQMMIVHHALKAGFIPRLHAQSAFARMQYASKHFGRSHRAAYLVALVLRHALRAALPGSPGGRNGRLRASSRLALSTILGRTPPPFAEPPAVALAPVESSPHPERSVDRDRVSVPVS